MASPWIFLHGFGETHPESCHVYVRLQAALPANSSTKIHAPTYHPGGDVQRTRFEPFLGELERLAAESPTGRVFVVGYSVGGLLAAHFAVRAPDRVAGLLLLAPAIDNFERNFEGRPEDAWFMPKVYVEELRAMPSRPGVDTTRVPTYIVHGQKEGDDGGSHPDRVRAWAAEMGATDRLYEPPTTSHSMLPWLEEDDEDEGEDEDEEGGGGGGGGGVPSLKELLTRMMSSSSGTTRTEAGAHVATMGRPPSLCGDDGPGTFTFETIRTRLPAIIESTIDANGGEAKAALGPAAVAGLRAISKEMIEGAALTPLHTEWDAWPTMARALAPGGGRAGGGRAGGGSAGGERGGTPSAGALPSAGAETWYSAPWFLVENYLYKRILAVMPSHIADPFAPAKARSLEASRAAFVEQILPMRQRALLAAAAAAGGDGHTTKRGGVGIEHFVYRSLWGNKADLSLSAGEVVVPAAPAADKDDSSFLETRKAGKGAAAFEGQEAQEDELLLAGIRNGDRLLRDDMAGLLDILGGKPPATSPAAAAPAPAPAPADASKEEGTEDGTEAAGSRRPGGLVVIIVMDNAGLELVTDLALADALLLLGHASRVDLHVKDAPVFVSDVVAADIFHCLDWMDGEQEGNAASNGGGSGGGGGGNGKGAEGGSGGASSRGAKAMAAALRGYLAEGRLRVLTDETTDISRLSSSSGSGGGGGGGGAAGEGKCEGGAAAAAAPPPLPPPRTVSAGFRRFYTSPEPFWSMPSELASAFAAADLVIFKGDANYRRLVGDAHWPHDTPLAGVLRSSSPPPSAAPAVTAAPTAAAPPPPTTTTPNSWQAVRAAGTALLALRTCKSGVLVGVPPHKTAAAAEAVGNGTWLTAGTYGVVHLCRSSE